jgi:predicted helicase
MSGANDLFSWATAVRLSGGKPFDESIANDATFNITAYQAADKARMDALDRAVKSTVIGNASPSSDQVSEFAQRYAAIGGKQINFNKYMINQIKNANTVQANKIMENLRNPYSQRMQQIMGGAEGLDGRSFTGDAEGSSN